MEVRSVIVFYVSVIVILLLYNVTAPGPARANRLLSYMIPEARELKVALGYSEDTYLNFTELTHKHGYRSEEHTVTTEDGYILTAYRILPNCNGPPKLYPVLLMHGLFDSSDVWIVPGTELGIGYILAANCYDVWAVNHRGNTYSRRHVTLDPDEDIEYWDYSFDEHGNYDVPAFVDYILQVTNKPRVFYVGHSQGTTDFFVMMSLRPEYNEKVQLSIHLAPVAWMTNLYSPIPRLLAENVRPLKEILDSVGLRELFAKHQLSHFIAEKLCHFAPEATCETALALSTGLEQGSIKRDVLKVGFGHVLSGTSTKTLVHFSQLIVSTKFKRFDEGFQLNMKKYRTPKPPEYDVSQIVSPVVLISGQNDWVSSLKDVATLSSKLPNVVENYVVPVKKWSHHNHLWDERAQIYVNPKIVDYFNRYNF